MTTSFSDVNLAISGCNLAFLALGRFVFLPYQRDQVCSLRSCHPPCRTARAARARLLQAPECARLGLRLIPRSHAAARCAPCACARVPDLLPLRALRSVRQVAKAGPPMQNGMTHAAAGDIRAQEATGVLKTGDPAGFNLVDVAGRRSVRTCLRAGVC